MIFIDSNIPMYAAGSASPQKEPCIAIVEAIANGTLEAASSAEVLQEILHRYHAIKCLEEGAKVYDLFRGLPIHWLNITASDVDDARHLLVSYRSLSSRDALHLAVMRRHKITQILTYDKGFLGKSAVTVHLPEQLPAILHTERV